MDLYVIWTAWQIASAQFGNLFIGLLYVIKY